MLQQLITHLQDGSCGQVRTEESLAPYTTWKIGGKADIFVECRTREQLFCTLKRIREARVPYFLIGRGSNLLVADQGFRGVVIRLAGQFESLHIEGDVLTAGGAYSLIKLSVMAGKAGLTGLEFAGGIPGTVGGAVYMNAGAHGSDMSSILSQAEVVTPDGELVTMKREELKYRYRHSILHEQPGIVIEAVMQLHVGDRKRIAQAMSTYKNRRLQTQPLMLPCAGSVFRNPEGHFAARLIEEAGLKGAQIGGAQISPLHANFIVNTGEATASDVLALIDQVRQVVKQQTEIELVPEVLVVGER